MFTSINFFSSNNSIVEKNSSLKLEHLLNF